MVSMDRMAPKISSFTTGASGATLASTVGAMKRVAGSCPPPVTMRPDVSRRARRR
jgi:hypothetical protein